MLWNALLLALREIRRNMVRSFLTILGVVIGVSAVITMVTLGQGATRAVSDQIASLGSNLLMIRPGSRMGPTRDMAGSPNFRIGDAEAIAAQVSGLVAVAPSVTRGASVVYTSRNWATSVVGTTADYFTIGNWELADGRFFNETEERAGAAACVIGETVRRELFGSVPAVGAQVRVKQFACEVIGVLKAKGQGGMGSDQDDTVVMPLRAVQRRLTGNQDVTMLRVSVRDDVSVEGVKERIALLMRERRKITAGEDDNFNVFDTRQIADTLSGTTRIMTYLLGAVAAVSLVVGGIGIMNIMLVSVTERTREIGIRLAIGAREREVLLQFLVEAVALAAFGGVVGVALAVGVSIILADVMGVPYLFNPEINLLSFAFAGLIGIVFGYFPARRAARLDPIEALRHE